MDGGPPNVDQGGEDPLRFQKWILQNLRFYFLHQYVYPAQSTNMLPPPAPSVQPPRSTLKLSDSSGSSSHDSLQSPPPPLTKGRNSSPRAAVPNVKDVVRKRVQKMKKGSKKQPVPQQCDCIESKFRTKCTDNQCCVMRANRIECDEKCVGPCRNKRILTNEFPQCISLQSKLPFGWCVISTEDLPEGEWIMRYLGEIKTGKLRRLQRHAYPFKHMHTFANLYVDALKMGNEARYLQHSEDPNCRVEEWVSNGEIHLVVIADEDILAETVLTVSFPQMVQDDATLFEKDDQELMTAREMREDERAGCLNFHPQLKLTKNLEDTTKYRNAKWDLVNNLHPDMVREPRLVIPKTRTKPMNRKVKPPVATTWEDDGEDDGEVARFICRKSNDPCNFRIKDIESYNRHYRQEHAAELPAIKLIPIGDESAQESRRKLQAAEYAPEELIFHPGLENLPIVDNKEHERYLKRYRNMQREGKCTKEIEKQLAAWIAESRRPGLGRVIRRQAQQKADPYGESTESDTD